MSQQVRARGLEPALVRAQEQGPGLEPAQAREQALVRALVLGPPRQAEAMR